MQSSSQASAEQIEAFSAPVGVHHRPVQPLNDRQIHRVDEPLSHLFRRMRSMLKLVRGPAEAHPPYRKIPIADLLAYHNWEEPHRRYWQAELLVGMCMDHRKRLRIPENFAYVMRAAGASFRGLEFQMSFTIALGGVRAIVAIDKHEGTS